MKASTEPIQTYPETEVFFVYKWDPSFFSFLRRWLVQKGRYLVILEEEGFCKDPSLEKLLEQDQVRFHIFSSPLEKKERLKAFFWEFVLLKKQLFTSASYQKQASYLLVKESFEELSLGLDMVASELNEMDLFYENVYSNFLHLQEYQKVSDYKGAFSGMPAFLLGAGTSLKRNKKLLQNLQEKALFFAAGTAFEALQDFSIRPHFVSSVDKQAPSSCFEKTPLMEVPLFFQLRSNPQIVQKSFFRKVMVSDHPFYPLQNRLYKALEIPEFTDSGWNVATFFLSQMLHMGCDPIILVGLDFAFSSSGYYAHKKEHRKEELIPFKSKEGKTLFTKKDFLLAAKWVEKVAEENPGRIYNASSGGISFTGVEEVSLEKLSEKFLQDTFIKEGDIKRKIASFPSYRVSVSEKKEELVFLKKSFNHCLEHGKRLFSFLEKHFVRLLKRRHFPDYLLEKAWKKEIAYVEYLDPLWLNWKEAFLREKDKEVPLFLHNWLQKLIFIQEKAEKQIALIEKSLSSDEGFS